MAKVVVCPQCQHQGSVPDEMLGKRIKCPKCKDIFEVSKAVRPGGTSSTPRPAVAKRSEAPPSKTAFDDLDDVQQHEPRVVAGSTRGGATMSRQSHSGAGAGHRGCSISPWA